MACELVASWTVQVGDLDQCVHLWRYTGGFAKVDLAERELKKDPVCVFLIKGLSPYILIALFDLRIMSSWQLNAVDF